MSNADLVVRGDVVAPDRVIYNGYVAVSGKAGLACGVHNQMQELTRRKIARLTEAGDIAWDAFARAHTPLIEDLATVIACELGARTGARGHVVHCSTSRGFDICEMYRSAGQKASIETCVQQLMLSHEEHAEEEDSDPGSGDMSNAACRAPAAPNCRPAATQLHCHRRSSGALVRAGGGCFDGAAVRA